MADPTKRFSDRVENYIKYRPDYPPEVFELLGAECGLGPATSVADIGSGTGILSEHFIKMGNPTYTVEPNEEMREAAEQKFRTYPNFHGIDGSAEQSSLCNNSVDLIVSGQAFHWFDPKLSKREFSRILRPGGWIALIWNQRKTTENPFLVDYEQFLEKYAVDYSKVNHMNVGEKEIATFFSPHNCNFRSFANFQHFDREGFIGRCLSSSYVPLDGPLQDQLMGALHQLFSKHERNGKITFPYDTLVYFSQIADPSTHP